MDCVKHLDSNIVIVPSRDLYSEHGEGNEGILGTV